MSSSLMDVDTFLETVRADGIKLQAVPAENAAHRAPETVDALFHLPLLSLAVMVIARRAPFPTIHLGRKVTLLLVEHFAALQRSPHGLETSITLRRRCADALAFLEAAGLAAVSKERHRIVTLTQDGKMNIDRAARDRNDLGLFIRRMRTNQERVLARIGYER